MPRHQLAQHLPPSTHALLRVLSFAPYGLFSRMYLCIIDSAHDVSSDQWAASVPFDYVVWLPSGAFRRHISFLGTHDLDH